MEKHVRDSLEGLALLKAFSSALKVGVDVYATEMTALYVTNQNTPTHRGMVKVSDEQEIVALLPEADER